MHPLSVELLPSLTQEEREGGTEHMGEAEKKFDNLPAFSQTLSSCQDFENLQ